MNILDPQIILKFFREYYLFFVLAVFTGTFLVTYYLIPKVLWVTTEKKLMKPVIGRSAHSRETPSFGGVAFFMTFVLFISMLESISPENTGNHLIAAITILFMVGLKDDLVISTAKVKLFGQLSSAAFIIFSPELQITSLYGFMGIFEIPAAVGYIISAFLLVAMINAYNLIDGINGLAGIIGIIICANYGLVFYLTYNPYYVIICCSVIGILLAFLRFNFSRGKNKIFMGDSGSLIIGLIIGFLTLRLLSVSPNLAYLENGYYLLTNRYLFILAVLFIPFFDTARVMLSRILNGTSPFKADRNHAHHVLLDLGLRHPQASALLGIINLTVIMLFGALRNDISNPTLTLCMAGIYALFFILFEWAARHVQTRRRVKV
ncbi:MAG TPA: MraY family glycosyltransferase [Salinimicrobium sp.]|nr:MraY family glycosyltransferase [Salinimicrobium sp.]